MASLLTTLFLPSTSTTPKLQSHTPPKLRSGPLWIQSKIREIFMPALSSTMTEGKIVSWIKSEGDRLSKGESVVVVESDKADMDVETFYDGFLAAIVVDEGAVAPVGSAIAFLAESEEEIAEAKSKASSKSSVAPQDSQDPPPPPPPPQQTLDSQESSRTVATPYAKKVAKEMKVEIGEVAGTGPMGRVVAKDVEAAAAGGGGKSSVSVSSPAAVELGSMVAFTMMQGAVSKNMVESLSVPGFRVGYAITTDALDELYKKIKSKGVTMTALLAKATAMALGNHPIVNSSCKDGKSFTYNSSINIVVAVAIDGGLITPVLQDADKLVDKARAKQLQPQEYTTGTYTLSNLGMFGVDRFDAILPPGTGAIMAVGASHPTCFATKDGRIGVKNQMQVNVTAHHRVIYGADLAAFLQTLAKITEDAKDLAI